MPTSLTPFTDAAQSLVSAAFGDPKTRRDNFLAQSTVELNDARIREAEATARRNQQLARQAEITANALNQFTPELFNLNAPVQVPGQALPPDVFGPPAPPTTRMPNQQEVSQRGSELASILARTGALNAGNLGDLLRSNEGAIANIGVTDPNARLRNAAAGAGNPFSTDEVQAQVFAGLPQSEQNLAARLNAFGNITPRNIQFKDAAGQTQNRIGVGPGFINESGQFTMPPLDAQVFTASTQAETPGQALGSSLTKTNITNEQQNLIQNQEAVKTAEGLLKLINEQTTGVIPSLMDTEIVGIANQLIPGFNELLDKTLPGKQDIELTREERGKLEIGINQLRTQLLNEEGKLSDKDQALVQELARALLPGTKASEARNIMTAAMATWTQRADRSAGRLTKGLDLRPGALGITNQDIDSMTEEELDRFLGNQ